MLQSSLEHYRRQQALTALAQREVRRSTGKPLPTLAQIIASYQLAAIYLTFESTPAEIAEQGITAPVVGAPVAASLLTSATSIASRLSSAATEATFEAIVQSLIQDAGRTAAAVDIGRRPAITGFVRSLLPPSCSRCAILAGRVYRYSQGFERHPQCDCLMTPTTDTIGPSLVIDPVEAVERGWVRGLSKADMTALDAGADLGRVVNVRRKAAGLSAGSSVISRAGVPTPEGVLRIASDRTETVALLRQYGYIT